MKRRLGQLLAEALSRLPRRVLGQALQRALRGRRIALCLHRVVTERRPGDAVPSMTQTIQEVDELIDLLAETRPATAPPWLTVAFDDGYADAVAYVESRADRRPEVEWLCFVCPEKIEKGAGFRWDLYDARRSRGQAPPPSFHDLMSDDQDVTAENSRADLRELVHRREFALASTERCRALQARSNVALGNHSNCHFKPVTLTGDTFQLDMDRSFADFERLFGACRHFAFPFGQPGLEFQDAHVRGVRRVGPGAVLWSTEPRPYLPEERVPGNVVPRFPIDGRRSPRLIVAGILIATLKSDLRQRRVLRTRLRPGAAGAAG